MIRNRHLAPEARVALVVLVMVAAPALSQEQDAQLSELRSRIDALTSELHESRSVRDLVARELRANEVESGRLVRQLRAIDGELAASEERLGTLNSERAARVAALAEQRTTLKRYLRASYRRSHQDYVKVLLNAQDPAALTRSLTYYGYFQRARSVQIESLRQDLKALGEVEHDIQSRTKALQSLQAEKLDTKRDLERQRANREALLAKLGDEIETRAQALDQLKRDEEKLEELLSGIQSELNDLGAIVVQTDPFSTLRGTLPWPSRGPLLHQFGARRRSGSLWQGVLIGAKEGQSVYAISHGRVAFADWLRGFGLLIILDHGDGYMSLYGRNESLLKEVGDWVDPGEPIAVVGPSAGSDERGLYFEIRHNGIPKNPARWCLGASPDAPDALVSG